MDKAEKIRILFEELEARKTYTAVVDAFTASLTANLPRGLDDEEGALFVSSVREAMVSIKERGIALMEAVYARFLTEGEIDELIELNKKPVIRRLRELQPEMMQIVMTEIQRMIAEDERISEAFQA